MAKITICDRCRKELEANTQAWQIAAEGQSPAGHGVYREGRELCITCYDSVLQQIKYALSTLNADTSKQL